MLSRDTALQMIERSIAELNETREPGHRMVFAEDLVLFGVGSELDSLDFVNLVAILEEGIESATGKVLTLTDSMFQEGSEQAFRTVSTLANYVADRVATAPA